MKTFEVMEKEQEDYERLTVFNACREEEIYISYKARIPDGVSNIMFRPTINKEAIKSLVFFEGTFSRIPQGLTRSLPNLETIEINNCELKSISRDDLREYKNLKCLSLPDNDIEHLPGDLFADMKKLEMIVFRNNTIKSIGPNLLDGLKKLKMVSFTGNPCINSYFGPNFGNSTLDDIKNELREKFAKKKKKSKKPKIAESKMLSDLKKAFDNEKLKDFTVQIEDEEFKVHKLMLAASSPVLAEMIEKNIAAKCLKLENISSQVFSEILKFIYTDKLPKSNDINFTHLFIAAGRLKIEKLKKFAAKKMIERVDIENAIEMLALAGKYQSDELKVKIFEIIHKYLNVNVTTTMQPERLKKLIEIKKRKEQLMREIEDIDKEFENIL